MMPSPLVLRSLAVVVAAVAAYYFSLMTLVRGLALDSPLAYLGLVPFISVGLVIARAQTRRGEPDIHDRHLDYIVGLPLLVSALAVTNLLPIQQSSFFWLWRLDIVSLPFFVAGAVCIVFGTRALWRLRVPIGFLLLAWPLPYVTLLSGLLDGFTRVTAAIVTGFTRLVPLALPAPGYNGSSVFAVNHGGQTFLVAIASACSGVNGVVGFLLIGLAFGFLAHGRPLGKGLWLIAGMLLIWALNVVRVLLIFAVGALWGEGTAIDWIHPFGGLVFFGLGVLAMALAAPRFGVEPGITRNRVVSVTKLFPNAVTSPRLAVSRAAMACTIVLAAGVIGMVANSRMQQYELVAQDLGTPRLTDLSVASAHIPGWSLATAGSYSWVRQYFGPSSTWNRYEYDWQSQEAPVSAFQSSHPVVMDVISTDDLNTFATYGLQACYGFHEYRVLDARAVALGGGVVGHALTYHNQSTGSDWVSVYWEWPVQAGSGYRYERVVLMLAAAGERPAAPVRSSAWDAGLQLAVSDWLQGSSTGPLNSNETFARDFLVGFAQQVVISAAAQSGTSS